MTNKTLYGLWATAFIVCAGLGFIPEASGAGRVMLTLAAVTFFLPPAVILYRGDGQHAAVIRNLSLLSLGLTLALMILNILSALRSETLGMFLHAMLTIVSAPMMCSGYWVVSLFLWAMLLVVSAGLARKKR